MDLSYFNPRLQTEPDFLANFVARQQTLEFFLRQLRPLRPEQAARHFLLVAPRGFGKTSLLRRIAIATRAEADLRQRYIPLSFREEQHNVISLDVFWRNCLQSLLEAREDEQAPAAELDELDEAWSTFAPRQGLPREEQDGEPAYNAFRRYCTRLQRRPLLLIDNLDSLLAGLGTNHPWALRRVLQAAGGPVLIAAAARYPESIHDAQAAFYDFFRVHTLDKLSDAEVMHCLRGLAVRRGEPGRAVLDLLDRDPGRVAALNTLAGGNPRTLNVLYSVLESHLSSDILSQLSAMLDTFTGWYQARIEELPLQARAVFDALALNWDPVTAAALGEITGLETGAVSSHLSRLERIGYVESVALNRRGKGRNAYQVSERFFNIWYLMRNGPRRIQQRIRFLTVFLQSCFQPAERRAIAQRALSDDGTDPGVVLAVANCLPGGMLRQALLERAARQSRRFGNEDEYRAAISDLRRLEEGLSATQPDESLEEIEEMIQRHGEAPELERRVLVARALVNKGVTLRQLGRPEQALAAFEEVVARDAGSSEPALREQVAKALVNKGFTLGQLGRPEQALAAYDEVITRDAGSSDPALREQVAAALFNKGGTLGRLGRADEAASSLRQATALATATLLPSIYSQLGNLLLDEQGDPVAALDAYRSGLATSPTGDDRSFLHLNCAYALALHVGDRERARQHLELALADNRMGEAGRRLLRALSLIVDENSDGIHWTRLYEQIGSAVEAGDPSLWSDYLDDLQRLLWFVIASGQGATLRGWLETARYPLLQAPLYHAVIAAIDGDEHLLQINPETRQAAQRIYDGLARRLRVYAPATKGAGRHR